MFQITLQANLIDLKRWLNMLLERTAQKETWQSTMKIIIYYKEKYHIKFKTRRSAEVEARKRVA